MDLTQAGKRADIQIRSPRRSGEDHFSCGGDARDLDPTTRRREDGSSGDADIPADERQRLPFRDLQEAPLHGDGRHGRRSEEHTSELQSLAYLVCRLLLEKKKKKNYRSSQTNQ